MDLQLLLLPAAGKSDAAGAQTAGATAAAPDPMGVPCHTHVWECGGTSKNEPPGRRMCEPVQPCIRPLLICVVGAATTTTHTGTTTAATTTTTSTTIDVATPTTAIAADAITDDALLLA